MVRFDTVIGLDVPVPVTVTLPAMQLTVYCVIADPPLFAGAVNAIEAEALPGVATPMVGAPGTDV